MRFFVTYFVVLVLGAAPSFAQNVTFHYATDGDIPRNTSEAGYEASGEALFACVTPHRDGLHPGKVRPGLGGCNIGFGGGELTGREYEVIGGSGFWTEVPRPGEIPSRALEAGYEANGAPLYVCRGVHAGGLHPGKIRQGFGGCNIGYGGREVTITEYEVLEY